MEEHAHIEVASLFLMDKDRNVRHADEWIFIKEITSNGDTKGENNFINKQLEIIGSNATNIASLVLKIGKFIKSISNGFYPFKEKILKISGVSLLDPTRIRLTCES